MTVTKDYVVTPIRFGLLSRTNQIVACKRASYETFASDLRKGIFVFSKTGEIICLPHFSISWGAFGVGYAKNFVCGSKAISLFVIQQIPWMPIYEQKLIVIRGPYISDVLRYRLVAKVRLKS